MKPIVVIGLGNPLMADEGIGPALVRELRTHADEFPGVEFADLGAGGLAALHVMAGRQAAIFLDCARMGEPPGAIRRFTPDEVAPAGTAPRLSPHAGDLLQTIELARKLGECPNRVIIFGIQPERVAPGEGLSPCLQSRFDEYLRLVRDELRALAGR